MAVVQLDLFGWNESLLRDLPEESIDVINVESLADVFIKYFGHWVGKTWLLGDDWTIAETLVTIHKVFAREQLLKVSQETWDAAWNRFNAHYLTNRSRNIGFQLKWWPER